MDIRQISEKYQLNETEVAVLNYMQEHRDKLKTLGVRQLAKETFTSPSFIVKMAKRMNLSGYYELVFLMTDTSFALLNFEDLLNIKQYIESFKKLLNKHRDSMITIMGSGFSQNIANYMSEYFNIHGYRCTANSHLELIRKDTNRQNLIIVISNSGETKRLTELCQEANGNECDVIAFVGNTNSTIAQNVKLAISTDSFKPSFFDSSHPQLFFGLALIYFEVLMSSVLTDNQ
ncbi:SIS domain-containing protein [Ligilactobacillus sp. Marseille-Q7487]|uniref:MurR/RpiR family transcriptional regulator n=1 Tax=Ligilactobacillus sp. Marseille-Q7487 TaxID=3022128 RepID=UPI0024A8CEFB|nr:SIS domain-containing protein [Ligilactobacillus sp. Marseille-Q7487]